MITAQRKAFLIVPIKQFIHTHILKTVNQLKQKTDIRFYSVYENNFRHDNVFRNSNTNNYFICKNCVSIQLLNQCVEY